MLIHVSFATFYQYKGWIFDWSRNKPFSPWPYKKDFEPRKRAGIKFYKDISSFFELPAKEQEKFRVQDVTTT
jgi:hypothetical protein